MIKRAAFGAIAAAACVAAQTVQAVPVDLELALVIDTSGSVSQAEFELQRDGYVSAFNSASVQSAIQALGDAGTGGIAVSVFYFATTTSAPNGQKIAWTQLSSAADASAFATALAGLVETDFPGGGGTGQTNIAAGINLARSSILGANGFEGRRLTIDVSGDGRQNEPALDGTGSCIFDEPECADFLAGEVSAAASAGITINGLAIGDMSLASYFANSVQTSDGFTIQANDFADFAAAAQTKIFREITGSSVPEPGTLALLAISFAWFGMRSSRYTGTSCLTRFGS